MAKIGKKSQVKSKKSQVKIMILYFQKQTFLYFFTFRHALRTRNFYFSTTNSERAKGTFLQNKNVLKQCFNRGYNTRAVFLFIFLNYPVKIFVENFATPSKRRGILHVLHFENNRRSLRSRQNFHRKNLNFPFKNLKL